MSIDFISLKFGRFRKSIWQHPIDYQNSSLLYTDARLLTTLPELVADKGSFFKTPMFFWQWLETKVFLELFCWQFYQKQW